MGRSVSIVLGSLVLLAAPAVHAHALGRHYYITPGEMLEVYGSYRLSNGDVLKISREHRHYWAEMGATGRFEIVPVDSIVFAQKGGNILLSFEPKAFTTQVRVDGVGSPSASAAPVYG